MRDNGVLLSFKIPCRIGLEPLSGHEFPDLIISEVGPCQRGFFETAGAERVIDFRFDVGAVTAMRVAQAFQAILDKPGKSVLADNLVEWTKSGDPFSILAHCCIMIFQSLVGFVLILLTNAIVKRHQPEMALF